MTSSCFAAVLPGRGLLAVGGDDRASFLHGIISNAVTTLAAETATWSALLTPQGKFLHDLFMVPRPDCLWLDGEAARLEDLQARLKRYRLRAKVTLELKPELAVVALWPAAAGPSAGGSSAGGPSGGGITSGELAPAGWPATPGACCPVADTGVLYADPRLAAAGWRLVAPADRVAACLESLEAGGVSLLRVDEDSWQQHRLRLGLPDGSADMVVEDATLLECGFEELNGIDFRKGCYVGQEVTARMRFRGLVKKRLLPVSSAQPLPPAGTPLLGADGRTMGEMRSSCDGVGLALVRLEALTEGQAVLTAGTAEITVKPADWMVFRPVKE